MQLTSKLKLYKRFIVQMLYVVGAICQVLNDIIFIYYDTRIYLQLDDGPVTFFNVLSRSRDKMFMMLNNVDIEQDMLWRRKIVMDMRRP